MENIFFGKSPLNMNLNTELAYSEASSDVRSLLSNEAIRSPDFNAELRHTILESAKILNTPIDLAHLSNAEMIIHCENVGIVANQAQIRCYGPCIPY